MEANQLVNAVPVWVQNFDEWLTGMCHSVETFCRLQEGVLVKMVQDVLWERPGHLKMRRCPIW